MSLTAVLLILYFHQTAAADYGSLTYYINDCVSDFAIKNSHAYVGNFSKPVPDSISLDTMDTFIISYSRIPEDGSILDANFNYYYIPEGSDKQTGLFHSWQNINSDGTRNYTVAPSASGNLVLDTNVSSYVCFDDTQKIPQYIGMWFWYKQLDTESSCREKTNSKSTPC